MGMLLLEKNKKYVEISAVNVNDEGNTEGNLYKNNNLSIDIDGKSKNKTAEENKEPTKNKENIDKEKEKPKKTEPKKPTQQKPPKGVFVDENGREWKQYVSQTHVHRAYKTSGNSKVDVKNVNIGQGSKNTTAEGNSTNIKIHEEINMTEDLIKILKDNGFSAKQSNIDKLTKRLTEGKSKLLTVDNIFLCEGSSPDYYLYKVLANNGYKVNKNNLRIIKEGIISGKYLLTEGKTARKVLSGISTAVGLAGLAAGIGGSIVNNNQAADLEKTVPDLEKKVADAQQQQQKQDEYFNQTADSNKTNKEILDNAPKVDTTPENAQKNLDDTKAAIERKKKSAQIHKYAGAAAAGAGLIGSHAASYMSDDDDD